MASGEKKVNEFPSLERYLDDDNCYIRLLGNVDSSHGSYSDFPITGTVGGYALIAQYLSEHGGGGGGGGDVDVGEYLDDLGNYTKGYNYDDTCFQVLVAPSDREHGEDSFYWADASEMFPGCVSHYFKGLPQATVTGVDRGQRFLIWDYFGTFGESSWCWVAASEYFEHYLGDNHYLHGKYEDGIGNREADSYIENYISYHAQDVADMLAPYLNPNQ